MKRVERHIIGILGVALLIMPCVGWAADQPSAQMKKYSEKVGEMLLKPKLVTDSKSIFYSLRLAPQYLSNNIPTDYEDASGLRIPLESNFLSLIEAIERHAFLGLSGKKQKDVLEKAGAARQALYRYIVAYRGLNELESIEERKAAFEGVELLEQGYQAALKALQETFDK